MKFLQSHCNDCKVSIALSQIVAVIEIDKGETRVYCTDKGKYTLTESYGLVIKKINMLVGEEV